MQASTKSKIPLSRKQVAGKGKKERTAFPLSPGLYIHALVRDADRQKMSKTKGNVIDPLEIIERLRHRTRTRFTLAGLMAAPGTDIAFSESRTRAIRSLRQTTILRNAAPLHVHPKCDPAFGFVWGQSVVVGQSRVAGPGSPTRSLPGQSPGFWPRSRRQARFDCATLEDRWILSRFNRVTRRSERCPRHLPLPRSRQPHFTIFSGVNSATGISEHDQAPPELRGRHGQIPRPVSLAAI